MVLVGRKGGVFALIMQVERMTFGSVRMCRIFGPVSRVGS
jgi:hypothetical protein